MATIYKTRLKIKNDGSILVYHISKTKFPQEKVKYELNHICNAVLVGLGVW